MTPESILQTERSARIAWAALIEASDTEIRAHIDRLGHVEALAALRSGALAVREVLIQRALAVDVTRIEAATALLGATILTPEDPRWPSQIADLPWQPYALWVRGNPDLESLCTRSVAIVGARAATPYGIDATDALSSGMSRRDFTVVSGGAYGIDKAAHDGALAMDGPTILVSAAGIDVPYPAAHAGLFHRIAMSGAVVSESPPGAAPLRVRFLNRNRLIAAMTQGTVVVEAGIRSGSGNTAHTANALGRVVCAVPGPITSRTSAGPHELIRKISAVLVTDVDELADAVGSYGRDAATPKREQSVDDHWSEVDRAVYSATGVRRPTEVDELLVTTELSLAQVQSALVRLEGDGVVQRVRGAWQKVPESASRRRGAMSG